MLSNPKTFQGENHGSNQWIRRDERKKLGYFRRPQSVRDVHLIDEHSLPYKFESHGTKQFSEVMGAL
jgi:hypothetical protein